MFNLRKQWSTVLLIALILLIVIFSVLNVDPVNINFGFTMLEMPLVLVIIGTLLIGVLIAVIWSTSIVMRERASHKKTAQKIGQLEVEHAEKESMLNEQHKNEEQKLHNKIDHLMTENKNLNRRIHNLEAGRSVHHSE